MRQTKSLKAVRAAIKIIIKKISTYIQDIIARHTNALGKIQTNTNDLVRNKVERINSGKRTTGQKSQRIERITQKTHEESNTPQEERSIQERLRIVTNFKTGLTEKDKNTKIIHCQM